MLYIVRGICSFCYPLHLFWILPFQVREEIDKYGIKIYQFPDCDSDEDEEIKKQDKGLKVGWIWHKRAKNMYVEIYFYVCFLEH